MTYQDFQWQRDLVGLAAAELLALGIIRNHQILRANIGDAHAHHRSNQGVAEGHRRAHIEREQPARGLTVVIPSGLTCHGGVSKF
ncbi:hypothetical protein [Pseudomonas koreensis]|uniref:hypothetical protein n=1 Tax=Pseudomonas koreensis TaxID=198620 RepID=UPI00320B7D6E